MEKRTKITVRDLNLYYGENHALKDVNMNIRENCVTAFIGPSGCGKSTFLKTLKGVKPNISYPQLPESTIDTAKPEFN